MRIQSTVTSVLKHCPKQSARGIAVQFYLLLCYLVFSYAEPPFALSVVVASVLLYIPIKFLSVLLWDSKIAKVDDLSVLLPVIITMAAVFSSAIVLLLFLNSNIAAMRFFTVSPIIMAVIVFGSRNNDYVRREGLVWYWSALPSDKKRIAMPIWIAMLCARAAINETLILIGNPLLWAGLYAPLQLVTGYVANMAIIYILLRKAGRI